MFTTKSWQIEYLPQVKLLFLNMSEGLAIKQGTAGIGVKIPRSETILE